MNDDVLPKEPEKEEINMIEMGNKPTQEEDKAENTSENKKIDDEPKGISQQGEKEFEDKLLPNLNKKL